MGSRRGNFNWLGVLAAGFVLAAMATARAGEPVAAGGLTFSDELGGFEIVKVSGRGTVEDPIVIVQRLATTDPVVLVVRLPVVQSRLPFSAMEPGSFMRSAIRAVVINESHLPWIGFDFELQQERNRPSIYGDGLSFDQMGTFPDRAQRSTRFRHLEAATEPYDRLLFRDGSVDPGTNVEFDVNLLDISPVEEFYLLLHPLVPYS